LAAAVRISAPSFDGKPTVRHLPQAVADAFDRMTGLVSVEDLSLDIEAAITTARGRYEALARNVR
jgi:hypothetical protein